MEEWPAYDAALLLLGHVGERLNDLPTAFDAYRRIAQSVPIAARRVSELRDRVLEIVSNRLSDALESTAFDR